MYMRVDARARQRVVDNPDRCNTRHLLMQRGRATSACVINAQNAKTIVHTLFCQAASHLQHKQTPYQHKQTPYRLITLQLPLYDRCCYG